MGMSGAALLRAQGGDTVTVGHIGVGNRGAYLVGQVLQNPNVKVAAICDIKPDRLDKAATAAARDNPQTFTDYRKLLERKDLNAVFIASPCDLHVEMAIAALKAGKHVYCEKPAGINADSIRELVKVAKASKTVFQIGQQMRSDARLQKAIARLRDGVAGEIIMVKAQRHAGDDLAHEGPSADWFFNAKRSGDVIVEMAVHNLDACNWAIGSHPERAGGFGGTLLWKNDPPGRTNMDGYTLSYEYPNNVKMSFTQVFFHPRGLPNNGQYFYVYGTKGAVDLSTATFYPREKGNPEVLVEAEAQGQQRQRGRLEPHISAFFECVRTGKKPPAGIVEAATGALTAILGREAIYQKKVMNWQDFRVDV